MKSEDESSIQQQFYISPEVIQTQIIIEPGKTYTITNAIVCQPNRMKEENIAIKVLVKNNLTVIEEVDLKAEVGTGLIEFIKVSNKGQDPLQEDF